MLRPVRVAGPATVVQLTVLTATGAWLTWFDRPVAQQAWDDVTGLTVSPQHASWVWAVHRWLIVPTALSTMAWLAMSWPIPRPAFRRAAPMAVLILLAGAGLAILAAPAGHDELWWMTIGTNASGFRPVPDTSSTVIILADGSPVALADVRRWLLVHLTAGTLAVMAAIGGVALTSRRYRPDRERELR